MTAAHRIAASCFAFVLCLPAFAAAQNYGDGGGYTANGGFYDFVDVTVAGVDLGFGDDSEVEVPLPFTFSFFGNDYNFVTVGSNGGFAFTDGTGSGRQIGFSNSEPFPNGNSITNGSTAPPDVAPLWDDWNPGNGGSVWVLDDSVANGRVIVSWNGVPHFSNTPDTTFQAHIYDDGTIQFHYQDVNDIGAGLYDNGIGATIGIQDGDSAGGTWSTGGALLISHNARPPTTQARSWNCSTNSVVTDLPVGLSPNRSLRSANWRFHSTCAVTTPSGISSAPAAAADGGRKRARRSTTARAAAIATDAA